MPVENNPFDTSTLGATTGLATPSEDERPFFEELRTAISEGPPASESLEVEDDDLETDDPEAAKEEKRLDGILPRREMASLNSLTSGDIREFMLKNAPSIQKEDAQHIPTFEKVKKSVEDISTTGVIQTVQDTVEIGLDSFASTKKHLEMDETTFKIIEDRKNQ